jgi:hypothetical protein
MLSKRLGELKNCRRRTPEEQHTEKIMHLGCMNTNDASSLANASFKSAVLSGAATQPRASRPFCTALCDLPNVLPPGARALLERLSQNFT